MTKLFTFIDSDENGSTRISQGRGASADTAVRAWFDAETRKRLPIAEQVIEVVPVKGVVGVWCVDYHDEEDCFHIVHVVPTEGG